jgi:hypothetical protein
MRADVEVQDMYGIIVTFRSERRVLRETNQYDSSALQPETR